MEIVKTSEVIDIRQTQEYASYLKKEGWIVERIENTNYFIKKLPLIGSVLKIQRPNHLDIQTTWQLGKKYRVFQTIIEPRTMADGQWLMANGFKLSKSPYLPTKTLQIDLTQSIDKITANFKKDARYALRATNNLKLITNNLKDLENFREAWKKAVGLKRYVPTLKSLINLRNSFSTHKPVILTSHNVFSSMIGGAIFIRSLHDYAYYWQGFTNNEGRTSLSQYSLVYQGILWAKRMGCKVFDFEGIYDDRFPNKSWLGFTHFKKSFGGKEILYPGCYTKLRFPYFDR